MNEVIANNILSSENAHNDLRTSKVTEAQQRVKLRLFKRLFKKVCQAKITIFER